MRSKDKRYYPGSMNSCFIKDRVAPKVSYEVTSIQLLSHKLLLHPEHNHTEKNSISCITWPDLTQDIEYQTCKFHVLSKAMDKIEHRRLKYDLLLAKTAEYDNWYLFHSLCGYYGYFHY
jgi:hypothetical protein